MGSRLRPCDGPIAEGRLSKARQFLDSATVLRDVSDNEAEVGDAFVTLCVHAGIAASDALCCRALGHHAQGDNHNEAIAELRKVDRELARDLQALLGMKTRAGYSDTAVTANERKRAFRAADRLVNAAATR
jgi:hypothetical protein